MTGDRSSGRRHDVLRPWTAEEIAAKYDQAADLLRRYREVTDGQVIHANSGQGLELPLARAW